MYCIFYNVVGVSSRNAVLSAMKTIEKETCVRFREKVDTDNSYVTIQNDLLR